MMSFRMGSTRQYGVSGDQAGSPFHPLFRSTLPATMGFFSRLFQPRTDGRPVQDDWTSLPQDSRASELVLLSDEAARLLAEVDIDAAIAGQARWLPWL